MTQTGTKLGVSITTRDARTRALTGSPRLSLRHKHARPTITNVLKRESRVPSDARRQLGTAVHPPTAATLRNGLNDRNRPRAEILPSITRPGISADERARVSKRRAARLQTGIPKIPRLDHMRPDLRRNRDIGCACRSGIEKAFGGADLDQHRRKPA